VAWSLQGYVTREEFAAMKAVSSISLMLLISLSLAPAANADTSNWNIKTGFGDEITIKNGIFGNKKRVVKDRLGDKYETSRGLFGGTNTEVNLLGNSYSKKKGVFGTRETEVKSILGDSIKTKKGWFGRRTTTVDASGVTSLIGSAIGRATKKPVPPSMPGGFAPDVSTFGSQSAIDGLSPAMPTDTGLNASPQALDEGLPPEPQ